MWFWLALGSAVFAAMTSILATGAGRDAIIFGGLGLLAAIALIVILIKRRKSREEEIETEE